MASTDDVLDWLTGSGASFSELWDDESAWDFGPPTDFLTRDEAFTEAVSYRRKDVRCLTVTEESALVAALQTLADNGTWGGFVNRHGRHGAGIHGTLGPGAGTGVGHAHRSRSGRGRAPDPSGAPDSAVENAMNRFLPWHRVFLLEFEDELRAIDSSIVIPYWRWSGHSSLPSIVGRAPTVIKGVSPSTSSKVTASGELTVTRAPGTDPAVPTVPDTGRVDTALQETTFRKFTETLELVHNGVHLWVGGLTGTMSEVPISPADPAFWLVHAEVDRIWTRWTNSKVGERARLRKENRPQVSAGSTELPGIQLSRRGSKIPSLHVTTRAVNLGYGYDRLEDPVPSTCTRT